MLTGRGLGPILHPNTRGQSIWLPLLLDGSQVALKSHLYVYPLCHFILWFIILVREKDVPWQIISIMDKFINLVDTHEKNQFGKFQKIEDTRPHYVKSFCFLIVPLALLQVYRSCRYDNTSHGMAQGNFISS